MKSCPSCDLKYADDTLQFCLSDGTGLIVYSNEPEEPPTVFARPTKTAEQIRETNTNLGSASSHSSINWRDAAGQKIAPQSDDFPNDNAGPTRALSADNHNEKLFAQILSFAPVTVALMQNYWQWLYMAEYNSFQFPALLWNLHFWVWLLLLTGGSALCVLALRQNNNRGFAVIGLVVLAINFLLCLVPRR